MAGFSSVTSLESVVFANNASFDGTERGGIMTADGQLWIGATAAPHVKLGTLTSPDSSISIGYSSPNITLQVNGGAPYYSLTPYIVGTDTHSQYTTIAAAIAQAISDGASSSDPKNIYIKPKNGGYTENITLSDGINLVGFGQQTLLIGKITFSTSGIATVNGMSLQTNSDFALVLSGSSASILGCKSVFINCTNNNGISYTNSNGGSVISFSDCSLNVGTLGFALYSMSSPGTILFFRSDLQNTGLTTTAADNSNGSVLWQGCVMSCPHSISGTGSLSISQCRLDCNLSNSTCIATSGTGSVNVLNSELGSGTASCVNIGSGTTCLMSHVSVVSSNTNVLTGAGTLNYAFISFPGASSGHNVAVETSLNTLI